MAGRLGLAQIHPKVAAERHDGAVCWSCCLGKRRHSTICSTHGSWCWVISHLISPKLCLKEFPSKEYPTQGFKCGFSGVWRYSWICQLNFCEFLFHWNRLPKETVDGLWRHPRQGWMWLWAAWSAGWQPCTNWGWNQMIILVLFNPGHSMILWLSFFMCRNWWITPLLSVAVEFAQTSHPWALFCSAGQNDKSYQSSTVGISTPTHCGISKCCFLWKSGWKLSPEHVQYCYTSLLFCCCIVLKTTVF